MAAEKKETMNRKSEDAREFAELLNGLSDADREKIRYIMIGIKMGENVRAALTA